MLEHFAFDVFQGLSNSRRSFSNSPFQTNLRIYLKAQLLPHRFEPSLCGLLLATAQMFGAFHNELTEQKVKKRLRVGFVQLHDVIYDEWINYGWVYNYLISNIISMGCCASGELDQMKNKYNEAWQVFRRTTLAKPQIFVKNAEKVFEFLYTSIALPTTQQNKRKVAELKELLMRQSVTVREVEEMLQRLAQQETELTKKHRALLQDLKKIQSSMISVEEDNVPRGGSLAHQRDQVNKKPQYQRPSVSQINQAQLVQSFGRYSLPLTVVNTPQDQNIIDSSRAESTFSRNEELLQELQFARDCKVDLEMQVKKLSVQVQQQQHDLQELSRVRRGLLEQLQFKKNEIKDLTNDKNNEKWQNELIELNRQKQDLQEKLREVEIELNQYKTQIKKLDRQREEAVSQNRYLNGKVKDLNETIANTLSLTEQNNHSVNILPSNLHKHSRNLAISQSLDQKIQPTFVHHNSFSSQDNNKAIKSFIIVEEEDDSSSEQKYAILFNLFAHSKVLPSHTDFQAAVGTRTLITELFDRRPIRSDLLFTFDPITPNHFAKYIENKQNLLLLVSLPNGMILGGFAGTLGLNNEIQESFLFSLSAQREPMKLLPSRAVKRIDIDPAYLSFGNGELKMKARTLELTSNAGCFQSIYTWGQRAVPIEKFIGTTQRNLIVTSYQIHQLHFDEML